MKQTIRVNVMMSSCRTDNGPGTSRLADVCASADPSITLEPVGGSEFQGPEYYRLARGKSRPGREWMAFITPRDGGEWESTGDVPGLAYPEACRENPAAVGGGFTSAVTAVRETIADVVAIPLYTGEGSVLQAVWGVRRPIMFTPRSIAGCYEVGVNPLPRIRELVPGLDIRFLRTALAVREAADTEFRYWDEDEGHGVVPLGYAGSTLGQNGYLVW